MSQKRPVLDPSLGQALEETVEDRLLSAIAAYQQQSPVPDRSIHQCCQAPCPWLLVLSRQYDGELQQRVQLDRGLLQVTTENAYLMEENFRLTETDKQREEIIECLAETVRSLQMAVADAESALLACQRLLEEEQSQEDGWSHK